MPKRNSVCRFEVYSSISNAFNSSRDTDSHQERLGWKNCSRASWRCSAQLCHKKRFFGTLHSEARKTTEVVVLIGEFRGSDCANCKKTALTTLKFTCEPSHSDKAIFISVFTETCRHGKCCGFHISSHFCANTWVRRSGEGYLMLYCLRKPVVIHLDLNRLKNMISNEAAHIENQI
jgi:hypothetical protein